MFCCISPRMMGTQKGATVIKVPSNDPTYLGFLPALDKTMVASWSEPRVRRRAGGVFFVSFLYWILMGKIEPDMVKYYPKNELCIVTVGSVLLTSSCLLFVIFALS